MSPERFPAPFSSLWLQTDTGFFQLGLPMAIQFTAKELGLLAVIVKPVLLVEVSANVMDPGLTGVRMTTGVWV